MDDDDGDDAVIDAALAVKRLQRSDTDPPVPWDHQRR
jgi:hypothetical protein